MYETFKSRRSLDENGLIEGFKFYYDSTMINGSIGKGLH